MKLKLILFLFLLFVFANGLDAQVTLNPCVSNSSFTCVVLGSSTAAGAGPSHPDSTWVNKYRASLKAINPQNEVINLAVGGFTTYRIMPDGFVAPANRPLVDTLKNITKALSLNPDFIIVNLPSNDRQWPMTEQIANFDSIYKHSWNSGVPIYICTTQPITSSGAYQSAVRDSIVAKFSPHVIDFFTPIADSNNLVLPQYAADAVHLNDSGHAVLFGQVFNKDILVDVFEPASFPDLSFREIILPSLNCQDSAAQLGFVISNLGDTLQAGAIGHAVWQTNLGADSLALFTTGNLAPCATDTIWLTCNFWNPSSYAISGKINLPLDSNFSNNEINDNYFTVSRPEIVQTSDTLCVLENTSFQLQTVNADTLFWYKSQFDTVPLNGVGSSFLLTKDTALYAQAVSGSTTFNSILSASNTSNINFNGNMFNLVAIKLVQFDSILLRINSTGIVPVSVYFKAGKYQGFEDSASAWTLLKIDTLSVLNSGDSESISLPNFWLNAGDTTAFYVHMTNANQSLQYQSLAQPVEKSTAELSYLSGAGSAFNFGNTYPNRMIAASFHYSFGFNRFGNCATDLTAIHRVISKSKISITPDTLRPFTTSTVYATSGFASYTWVVLPQGDTISFTNSAVIDSTLLPMNTATQVTVLCFAEDAFGCKSSDTSVYTLVHDFGLPEETLTFNVYPNPANDVLFVSCSQHIELLELFDVSGKKVKSVKCKTQQKNLSMIGLPAGFYMLRISTAMGSKTIKVLKN